MILPEQSSDRRRKPGSTKVIVTPTDSCGSWVMGTPRVETVLQHESASETDESVGNVVRTLVLLFLDERDERHIRTISDRECRRHCRNCGCCRRSLTLLMRLRHPMDWGVFVMSCCGYMCSCGLWAGDDGGMTEDSQYLLIKSLAFSQRHPKRKVYLSRCRRMLRPIASGCPSGTRSWGAGDASSLLHHQ